MKKLLSVALILTTFGFANTVNLNTGWNLIGSSESVDVSKISDPNVKIIWRWHNNQWQAYSNDSQINSLISQYNFTTFTVTDPNEGFWVYSVAPTSIEIGDNTTATTSYPQTELLGSMYGLNWMKILAFYPGDTRWEGNVAKLDYDTNDIELIAYKKENQDSRAGVVTNINQQSGYGAYVNLVNDGVYSKFQALAIAKGVQSSEQIPNLTTTTDLTFIVFVNIRKNSINIGYEFDDNAGNYNYTTVQTQEFSQDLTNLSDKSDVKIQVFEENGTFSYTVFNAETNESLVDGSFEVPNLQGFNGFNYVAFRSRVDDSDGNAELNTSENIINDFYTVYYNQNDEINTDENTTVTYASVDDFLGSLTFTPKAITADNFTNKTFAHYEEDDDTYEFDQFSNDTMLWKEYFENGAIKNSGSLKWSVNNNVLLLSDLDGNLVTALVVKDQKNNTVDIVGYDFDEKDQFEDKVIQIDVPVDFGTEIDVNNLKSWFANTTFVDNVDTALLNKTWKFGVNDTITFDTQNGTVTHTDGDDNEVDNGGFYVQNGIIVCEFPDDNFTVYILPYNLTDNNLDAYVVFAMKSADKTYLHDIDEINAVPAQ